MSIALARKLRKRMPPAEARLWNALRELKPLGFHFRRQVPLGRYYADFACHHALLVIEVDGDTHGSDTAMQYDAERDAFIRAEGYEVLRFGNHDVMHNLEGVTHEIWLTLQDRPRVFERGQDTPTLDPSPQGGGRR